MPFITPAEDEGVEVVAPDVVMYDVSCERRACSCRSIAPADDEGVEAVASCVMSCDDRSSRRPTTRASGWWRHACDATRLVLFRDEDDTHIIVAAKKRGAALPCATTVPHHAASPRSSRRARRRRRRSGPRHRTHPPFSESSWRTRGALRKDGVVMVRRAPRRRVSHG